ncbi:uncharacterized protein LOC114171242 [Vigna unguiculata]|uniref:uncharacterized protein LOC114171242 n=1 Tax=Vigna unguiculata TaxID=3917 RepID=UPI001015CC4C|nr:uncharacterized protein LOC114171242 [Vigna unguiculata]
MKIKDLTPNLILHYMVMALRPGPFADELAMRPPLGMQELRKRASMFIRVEEIRHYQDRVRTTPTHLEAKRGEIPKPTKPDLSKYCHYHRNNCHTTEECETLRDKIEELVRAGHLRHYVKNTTEGNPRTQYEKYPRRNIPRRDDPRNEPREPRQEPRKAQILSEGGRNHLKGGGAQKKDPPERNDKHHIRRVCGGGCSSSSRKKHLRAVQSVYAVYRGPRRRMPPITFSDSDFRGVDPNQDDPVVITIELENFVVKKVLIDQGSLVDIIYWKTFQQLQIPAEELTPYDEPIYEFSGERVPTRGYDESRFC